MLYRKRFPNSGRTTQNQYAPLYENLTGKSRMNQRVTHFRLLLIQQTSFPGYIVKVLLCTKCVRIYSKRNSIFHCSILLHIQLLLLFSVISPFISYTEATVK